MSLQYERPAEGPPETDNTCASGRVRIPGTSYNNPAFSRSSNEYVLAQEHKNQPPAVTCVRLGGAETPGAPSAVCLPLFI